MEKTVLVVDDQRRYRDEVKLILNVVPLRIVYAEDGLDGLTKFRKEKPDIIIIDAMLPKLHGFQLAKAIRNSLPRGKDVFIILMSGIHLAESDQQDAITRYGANEFLVKPLNAKLLLERIRFYARMITA